MTLKMTTVVIGTFWHFAQVATVCITNIKGLMYCKYIQNLMMMIMYLTRGMNG